MWRRFNLFTNFGPSEISLLDRTVDQTVACKCVVGMCHQLSPFLHEIADLAQRPNDHP